MWRYMVVEIARADLTRRDELLWEHGRAGWELVQLLPGTWADGGAPDSVTLVFKRSARDDIGV